MIRIYVDVEARSKCDLKKCGSYRYSEDPSTSPLCVSWKISEAPGPARLWWAGDPIPAEWRRSDAVFVVFNAQFDRVFFDRQILRTRIEQWDDVMIRCRYYYLPGSLDMAGKHILGFGKDPRGDELVNSVSGRGVCKPQRVKMGDRYIEYWNNTPADLIALGEYCIQDNWILECLDNVVPPLPDAERDAWWMYERMNDNGIPVDTDLARGAMQIMLVEQARSERFLSEYTDGVITSSGQTDRMVKWAGGFGVKMSNCQADTVSELLSDSALPEQVRKVLSVRALGNSAAVKKYPNVLMRVCKNGRVHGENNFYGAHTGRGSAKGVQAQNGKRGNPKEYLGYLDAARNGRFGPGYDGWIDWGYHLSCGVRAVFRAADGCSLLINDYSGVEARDTSWLVGDEPTLEKFRQNVDVYKILAGSIFSVEPESIGKKDDRRSVGKEAWLAGQYGIGYKTYRKRLKVKWGVSISELEARHAINTFRTDQYLIPVAWTAVENAWRTACVGMTGHACYCEFRKSNGWLEVMAPNGRALYYYDPQFEGGLSYGVYGAYTTDKKTGQRKPLRKHTYGGAMLENLAQWLAGMIAKDHMVEIANRHREASPVFEWLFPVHDESIGMVPDGYADAMQELIQSVMTTTPWYCPGLPLDVEGGIAKEYGKI